MKKIKEKIAEEEKKNDGKNSQKRKRRKTMKRKGKPVIFKKNGQIHGLLHFVTRVVNILPVCYIYKNLPWFYSKAK